MKDKLKGIFIAVVAIAALAVGGAAIAGAAGGDDDATQKPISGSTLEKASAAALDHTGGGSVTETEVGDEEGAYEIEVKREDGSSVDVHLDKDFKVLNQVSDDDKGGEQDDGSDD